jgi:hypothetical protein
LYSASISYPDGTSIPMSLAGAHYEYETGLVALANDAFPKGRLNIDLECRAGYVQPTATDYGHQDWYDLEALAYRIAEIAYTDALNIRGRYEEVSAGSLSARTGSGDMPADVVAAIKRFCRRWA